MTQFEADRIYTVDAARVDLRAGEILFDDSETIIDEGDILRPVLVVGLEPNDIAITANFVLDEDGEPTPYSYDYLVTEQKDGEGIIVPGDMIERDPRTWMSPHLESLIGSLQPGEFERFGLPKLSAYIIGRSAA